MNLYEKINKAKLVLQSGGLKKSGRNEFAKYEYFELADFLPVIIRLEEELKFTCVISFTEETATLEIIDSEKPEDRQQYTSPMSSAALKGMHDVQNLGAVQTYIKRYLYTNAFEIVEYDAVDKSEPEQHVKTARQPDQLVTQKHLLALSELCTDPKTNKQDAEKSKKLKEVYGDMGYKRAPEIKLKDFEEIRRKLIESTTVFADENTELPFSMEDEK